MLMEIDTLILFVHGNTDLINRYNWSYLYTATLKIELVVALWISIANMPPQDRASVEDAYLGPMSLEMFAGESFGEGVSKLILCINMRHTQLMARHLIPNKEKINGNMLHAAMEDGIGTDISGTHIVTVDDRGGRYLYLKFLEKVTDLVEFCSCRSNGTKFCFSGWSGNCVLLFGTPANGCGTKEHNICHCGSTVIRITRPICIGKGMKIEWRTSGKDQAVGKGAPEVS